MLAKISILYNAQWKKNNLQDSNTIKRLFYANKNGLFNDVNSNSCALGFSDPEFFTKLKMDNITICHPEKSVIKKATKLNHLTFVNSDGVRKKNNNIFNTSFVNVTKSRKETYFYIAISFFITKYNGKIFIIGDKTLGINFFLKEIGSFIKLNILSKSHGKIGYFRRPKFIPNEISIWKKYGKYKKVHSDFYTLPGCFSEKGVDKGSELLVKNFSNNLHGKVVDLGAGWGYLSAKALENNKSINQIFLIESNLNALNCARVNISNPKAKFYWKDIEIENLDLKNFDHVIMNPPFHKDKNFRHSLVIIFLNIAKEIISKRGILWMVHNKELPYEKYINDLFPSYKYIEVTKNYKVVKAINNIY